MSATASQKPFRVEEATIEELHQAIRDGRTTCGTNLVDDGLCGRSIATLTTQRRPQIVDHHTCAFAREGDRGGAADPAVAPGHQRAPPGEALAAAEPDLILTQDLCEACALTVREVHEAYVKAGAQILETNTFGANRVGLAKYGLADKVRVRWMYPAVLLAWSAAGIATGYADKADASPPGWTIAACYIAIGMGTMFGGWRIVKTMGQKITKLKPVGGFCAETGGAMTLLMASFWGIPVSTTHTITGAIVGVGAARRMSAVRWNVASSIVYAWVITIPASAMVAAAAYWATRLLPAHF